MVERYSLNALQCKGTLYWCRQAKVLSITNPHRKGSASCIQAPVKRRQLKRRKKEVSLRKNRKDLKFCH